MESASPLPADAKLLLVDDHSLVHFGLRLVAEELGLVWLEGAKNPAEGLSAIQRGQPDLLVLDLVLGGRDRLDLLGEVRRMVPATRILVYSSLPEETYALRVFRLGAWAFVPKTSEVKELREALRAVMRGEIWARPGVLRQLSGVGRSGPVDEKLSDRELHVFRLLGEGKRPRTISDDLKLSVKTVHTYCDRLKVKLACDSLEELQQRAVEEREW